MNKKGLQISPPTKDQVADGAWCWAWNEKRWVKETGAMVRARWHDSQSSQVGSTFIGWRSIKDEFDHGDDPSGDIAIAHLPY